MAEALVPPGGVVAVGLRSEAALLPSGTRVVISGGNPARLAALLEALPGDVTAVLSFGIAGGLASSVSTGDLFVATALRSMAGSLPVDAEWRAALVRRTSAASAILAASDTLLASVEAKRALHRATRAAAVDMESGVAARFALARGIPFAALRVVADGPEDVLPQAAAVGLRPDGSPAVLRVLLSLTRRPWELPALIRLGKVSAKAHAALGRAIA
ncbi:hopanoid-associated phosphorylase [Roseococcus sp.]|uniref:phosphorylase family protein n=1 Tax=Roseococcus sp. TaxID=2109646 RepID=UPI003BA88C0C